MKIRSVKDTISAGKILLKIGVKNVLIKGGHKESKFIEDVLLKKNKVVIFKNRKIKTRNTHGTGALYQVQ